jgi:DNA-binding transcriptional LysR family regulator
MELGAEIRQKSARTLWLDRVLRRQAKVASVLAKFTNQSRFVRHNLRCFLVSQALNNIAMGAGFKRKGIGRSAKRDHQSISLGTTPLVAANILPPAMRVFRKQRPDVRIQLFDADLPTLIQMVEAGKLDMCLGIFKAMPDVRREPFFRFSLMVARAAKDDIQPRKTMTWSALDGETLISLSPGHPHQQLIDKHLAQAGVKVQIGPIVNLLDTQIALVEAEEGIAIIPSFGMPACRNRKVVMSQLINPVVRWASTVFTGTSRMSMHRAASINAAASA